MLASLQKREHQAWVIAGIVLVGLFLAMGVLYWRMPAAPVSGNKVYEELLRSTCWVCEIPEPNAESVRRGTGFLVDEKRKWVLTAYHVVRDRPLFLVCFPAPDEKGGSEKQSFRRWYLGQPVPEDPDQPAGPNACWHYAVVTKHKNPELDLALLELRSLPKNVQALKLAKASPKVDDTVHTVGNPEGEPSLWVYTKGGVRQPAPERIERKIGDQVIKARRVLVNSALNKGDSGGALVNDRCEVVGLVSSGRVDAQEMESAIDVTEIQAFLKEAEGGK
jgi:S1-C subfamily serine protease